MKLIQTSFDDLNLGLGGNLNENDNVIGGGFLFPSLVVVGGRPAMGKTALMLNFAKHFCENGEKVLWISLEEKTDRLNERFKQIGAKNINIEWYDCYFQFHEVIGLIREASRYVKIFFIDYIQLLYSEEDKSYESSSYITHTLKKLSNELNILIIVASQLNRKVEERTGHRPMLKDLRDSGSIEEDADQVILLLRREYYDPNDRPGMAELIIAKNRRGDTFNVNLVFLKENAEFVNYISLSFIESHQEEKEEIFRPFASRD